LVIAESRYSEIATRLAAQEAPRSSSVDDGGLISYGVDLRACFRRGAYYVHKILNGVAPGDLPIEFPTNLELVINLKNGEDAWSRRAGNAARPRRRGDRVSSRREFITLLGSAAAAWPLTAVGQQAGKVYRIGFLANDPSIPTQAAGQAFLDGLRESGFIEGKNIQIERRFAEGRLDRYDELVTELVQLRMDIIVTSANNATLAVKRTTTRIPVVMMNVYDPVGQGIVASLAHPGGNITGVIFDDTAEISAKRLQLIRDAIPGVVRMAILTNPDEPYARAEWNAIELAAQSLQTTLHPIVVRRPSEY
jgi:ABC-type uncharacterized transport system substrate-binding protein